MNKNEQNLNNEVNSKFGVSDITCTGYLIRFNEVNANGIIINKDAINIEDLDHMKIAGKIVDYEIDDNGVKIIKNFDLRSVSY